MSNVVRPRRLARPAALVAIVLALSGTAVPAGAQDPQAELRIRKLEAEVRALQRKVFPGGDAKIFTPEITQGTASGGAAAASGTPAATAVTEMLSRIDALEAQIARLTGQVEQNGNRISQIETRLGIAVPSAASAPAAAASAASAATTVSVPAATVSAPAPVAAAPASATPATAVVKPVVTATPSPVVTPAPTPVVTPAPVVKPAAAPAPAAKPATAPSSQRVAAVKAIEKPQSADAGEDEYSYGFRLWEAKFYPEAQQQLNLFLQKYPRHKRVSWGRNLLGRAYLDDGNPKEAAKWFLDNYQADKRGERAADSLLYLAVSMKQLKDNKRACIALAEFAESYSAEAAGRLKGLYDATRSGLTCS